MLSVDTIDPALKKQMKEQKLKQLQAQWFECHMTKIALEANGMTDQAAAMDKRMVELQVSYDTIAAIEVEGV